MQEYRYIEHEETGVSFVYPVLVGGSCDVWSRGLSTFRPGKSIGGSLLGNSPKHLRELYRLMWKERQRTIPWL